MNFPYSPQGEMCHPGTWRQRWEGNQVSSQGIRGCLTSSLVEGQQPDQVSRPGPSPGALEMGDGLAVTKAEQCTGLHASSCPSEYGMALGLAGQHFLQTHTQLLQPSQWGCSGQPCLFLSSATSGRSPAFPSCPLHRDPTSCTLGGTRWLDTVSSWSSSHGFLFWAGQAAWGAGCPGCLQFHGDHGPGGGIGGLSSRTLWAGSLLFK